METKILRRERVKPTILFEMKPKRVVGGLPAKTADKNFAYDRNDEEDDYG